MSKASSIVKTVLGLIIGLAFVGAGVFALLYVLNEEPAAPSKPSGQVEPEPEVDVLGAQSRRSMASSTPTDALRPPRTLS